MTVTHASFTLERSYPASPNRVFRAFSDPACKALWWQGPEEFGPEKWTMDFRVGGGETSAGGPPGGPVHRFASQYYDIVADERIVYAYEMYLDDKRISVSVATIEIAPDGEGTKLVLTEQGAFLDGLDLPVYREQGTAELLDNLGRSLHQEPATT